MIKTSSISLRLLALAAMMTIGSMVFAVEPSPPVSITKEFGNTGYGYTLEVTDAPEETGTAGVHDGEIYVLEGETYTFKLTATEESNWYIGMQPRLDGGVLNYNGRNGSQSGAGPNSTYIYITRTFNTAGTHSIAKTLFYYGNNFQHSNMNPVEIEVNIIKVDLDVDSDNNNGVGNPDRNDTEDGMEEATGTGQYGKFVMVNQNDDDKDGIPDYSDLEVVASSSVAGSANEGQFVPLKLEIQPDLDWSTVTIKFDYDGNASMNTAPFAGTDIGNGYRDYTGAKTGKIRIWMDCVPSDSRDALNYVMNGTEYTASALGFSDSANEKTFYIEGINPVEKSEITATVKVGTTFTCSDKVVVTVVDANLGVNCNNNLVNGDGMRVGIPDVEFTIDVDDDIIEDQKDGFQFWWGRDTASLTISELGLVDLAPFVVDIPASLRAAGFKFYLKIDAAGVDVYPAVSPSSNRRHFLQAQGIAVNQIAKASDVVVIGSAPMMIPINVDGKNEFVFKAQGSGGSVTGKLSLIVEEPVGGPAHRVAADSVKLTLKRTRDFYTMMSTRGTKVTDGWLYDIEDGLTQWIDRYPWATKIEGPDPDSERTQFLVHVHGYNVNEDQSYDEMGETYRRVYWTGFRGNFVGFGWHGHQLQNPGVTPYGQNVENAFETAPCFWKFLQDDVLGSWGASVDNVDVFLHSLGNQVGLDGLRLQQAAQPGVQKVGALTSIEAAIWSETFWPQASFVYAVPPNADGVTYTVAGLKRMSWAFWFNQNGQKPENSMGVFLNSFNYDDYALDAMRLDDWSIRNPGPRRYNRFDHPEGGIVTENRAPYDRLALKGIDLAHRTPAMFRDGDRTSLAYTHNSLNPCQGQIANPQASVNLNASSSLNGWHVDSHAGFKGEDGMGISPTPLSQIWFWFRSLYEAGAYEIGEE
jgi:hypothetical protein